MTPKKAFLLNEEMVRKLSKQNGKFNIKSVP